MIDIYNLVKHYDKGLVKALNGISLSIPKGNSTAIMGPSGCGKTTLLNLIGTLDKPSSGKIIIDGKNINDIKNIAQFRNSQIGFIFQFHNLIPNISLLENVALPTYAQRNISNKQKNDMALKLLKEMGISDKAKYTPPFVSGGQRQLAAVARALINSPKIILADEPTGNVDSETAYKIMSILMERCEKEKITLLVVSHNKEIANFTDEIFYMRDGKLAY